LALLSGLSPCVYESGGYLRRPIQCLGQGLSKPPGFGVVSKVLVSSFASDKVRELAVKVFGSLAGRSRHFGGNETNEELTRTYLMNPVRDREPSGRLAADFPQRSAFFHGIAHHRHRSGPR
jgi:hypothetical protein